MTRNDSCVGAEVAIVSCDDEDVEEGYIRLTDGLDDDELPS